MEIEQIFFGIPPITRYYLLAISCVSIATTFELLSPLSLYLNWRLILEEGEVWRLVSCFVFFGPLNFHLFLQLHFIYMYLSSLESHFYINRTLDCIVMLIVAALELFLIAKWSDQFFFLGSSLSMMLVYLWSRRFPDEILHVFGLVQVGAPYLPYVMLGINWMMNMDSNSPHGGLGAIQHELMAIAAGHVLWYVSDIVPKITGVDVMRMPGRLILAAFPMLR